MSTAPEADLDRVEWRVQGRIDKGGGVNVVAYLDGVYVAELLDAWVGNVNWFDRYEPGHGKSLFCHLSVRLGDEWITKVDVGVPSQQESEKGLVSDAFKRAAMRKWRVGHNVYSLPILRLEGSEFRDYDGKAYLNGASAQAIERRLEGLGFSNVGRVATSEPDETPTTSTPASSPEPQSASSGAERACVRCEKPLTGAVERADGGYAHKGECP